MHHLDSRRLAIVRLSLRSRNRITAILFACAAAATPTRADSDELRNRFGRRPEAPSGPYAPPETGTVARATSARGVIVRGPYVSVQVNVDSLGRNVVNDAANEPSIAVDPNNRNRMAIGWRQFDTIDDPNAFRQAGIGYSTDGGQSWTVPGVLAPSVFSSDPVLDFDAEGRFYYYALQPNRGPGAWSCYLYRSENGGVTWPQEVYAYGGDKAWMTVDRTGGMGHGHLYFAWSPNIPYNCCGSNIFTRSTDGGQSFMYPVELSLAPRFGTLTVAADGAVFITGGSGLGIIVTRSSNAQNAADTPTFDQTTVVDLGGGAGFGGAPNPGGLVGQIWIASDHSDGPTRGNLYLLASVDPPGDDPLDVMFARSTDGGATWSDPVRVNDDSLFNGAWQWFGTISVAPTGRIDVIWNDTRNSGLANLSELFYAFSLDAGQTWSDNVPVSPMFNSWIGWPQQNKIGDYYDMISDVTGVNIAYAATFNGEQDVYYLRIDVDCNANGFPDDDDLTSGRSPDCDNNGVPDECDDDCNDNGLVDLCETRDGVSPDCDGDDVPDECDPDFDGDGEIDGCDADIDDDGVLNEDDVCDFTPLGAPIKANGAVISDLNIDCAIQRNDYRRFPDCLGGSGPGRPLFGFCPTTFDYGEDSDIDLRDFAALQLFFGP